MFSACCKVAFINDYTRYCPKCGQECGIEYKETISWIKCNECIPPNDESVCITKYPPGGYIKLTGKVINDITKRSLSNIEWIPYTEETWRKLNGRD